MEKEESKNLEISIMGDFGVGKTQLRNRFVLGGFEAKYFQPLIGVNYFIQNIKLGEKEVDLKIHDTQGTEKYFATPPIFFRSSDGIILMFDLSNRESFENIKGWYKSVKKEIVKNIKFMLVGGMADLISQRQVGSWEAQEMATQLSMPYVEVSSKIGYNITECFEFFAHSILSEHFLQLYSKTKNN